LSGASGGDEVKLIVPCLLLFLHPHEHLSSEKGVDM